MALNPFFSDAAVQAGLNAQTALCRSGTLNIYSGAQPADANTAVTSQVLLATLAFQVTAFAAATVSGSPGSRVVTAAANAITTGTAVASGTATWFRVLASDGTTVFDGSAGANGCDLDLSPVAITAGMPVSVGSFTISQNE